PPSRAARRPGAAPARRRTRGRGPLPPARLPPPRADVLPRGPPPAPPRPPPRRHPLPLLPDRRPHRRRARAGGGAGPRPRRARPRPPTPRRRPRRPPRRRPPLATPRRGPRHLPPPPPPPLPRHARPPVATLYLYCRTVDRIADEHVLAVGPDRARAALDRARRRLDDALDGRPADDLLWRRLAEVHGTYGLPPRPLHQL